jgi:hypothetical protein
MGAGIKQQAAATLATRVAFARLPAKQTTHQPKQKVAFT